MRPQPIDRASLTRQFLAAAANRAVDTGLPRLTPVDAGLPPRANVKNEPKPSADATGTGGASPYVTAKKPAKPGTMTPPPPPSAVDARLPQLTPVDARLRIARIGKTNPPPSPQHQGGRVSTLSTQQLAAARLLACGRAPTEVAAELGVTRQALWKWRRRADFDAEVFRLHECLTWTAGATRARRP